VNASPSLSANTKEDYLMKCEMLNGMLDVVDMEGVLRGDEEHVSGECVRVRLAWSHFFLSPPALRAASTVLTVVYLESHLLFVRHAHPSRLCFDACLLILLSILILSSTPLLPEGWDLVYDNGFIEIDPAQCGYSTFLGAGVPEAEAAEDGPEGDEGGK
jgi:hypothetical protein